MKLSARLGAVTAAVVVAMLAAAGTAFAGENCGAHAVGHGTFALATFDFTVDKAEDGHVSGYFKADATAPASAFIHVEGPVTCAVFQGNRVGFLYPLAQGTMPAALQGNYILISGEDNGGGGMDKVGFQGPLPRAAFPNCNPSLTAFPVNPGSIKVSYDRQD